MVSHNRKAFHTNVPTRDYTAALLKTVSHHNQVYEMRGNPGVFDALRPLSNTEWEADWAIMRDWSPPPPSQSASGNAGDAHCIVNVDMFSCLPAPQGSNTDAFPFTDPSSDGDSEMTGNDRQCLPGVADDDCPQSPFQASGSDETDSSGDEIQVAIPSHSALRDRSDPVVVGSNGFRLLHKHHRFVRGIDQSEHLTLRYVDDIFPGVVQEHRYVARGRPHTGSHGVNWNSAEDIARLNRWTCQFLKRHGAPKLRREVIWFTGEERRWLRWLGQRMLEEGGPYAKQVQTRMFNKKWAGTLIRTGKQSGTLRPVRTTDSLQSEIHRSSLYPEALKLRRA